MSTKTGLLGEHITIAVLLEQDGWSAAHTPMDGVDVVAWKDGVFMRVQVKTSTLRSQGDRRTPSYHFQLGSGAAKKIVKRGTYDILACCAATDRAVWFQAQCCVNQLSMRKARGFFAKPDLERDSWQRAVSIVMEGRQNGLD